MVVTFCGHGTRNYNGEIKLKLYEIVENLIKIGAKRFLLGGYGDFDTLAASTGKRLKEKYSHIVACRIGKDTDNANLQCFLKFLP